MMSKVKVIAFVFASVILFKNSRAAETEDSSVEASAPKQWTHLFDGKDLSAWKTSSKGEVNAVDGEIQILATENLWLLHQESFADFELEVEALMPATKYNSGIGFRCDAKSERPIGYQCEIEARESGSVYAIGKGWVWPKGVEGLPAFRESLGNVFKQDAWNRFRICCRGNRIQIWINGIKVTDIHDDLFKEGSVALQHHGKGGVHRFRNIRIKQL